VVRLFFLVNGNPRPIVSPFVCGDRCTVGGIEAASIERLSAKENASNDFLKR